MKTLRAGIIGAGFIGVAHIEAIRRLGFVEVAALSHPNKDTAERQASELGIPKGYGDYRDMLADPDIDVIHNCTPNHLHFQINKDIIQAGKHVLSEKPLALTSAQSAELLELATQHRIVHGVNFVYRQYPMVQQMRAMVQEDQLGSIHLVHGSYLQDWLLLETDYNWRMAPEIGGKSRAVADIGSHWCDAVQHITGQKIVKVFADLATVLPTRKKAASGSATFGAAQGASHTEDVKIETEDYASVLFHMENGTRGVFTVSQVSAGRKNRLNIEINGSKQSAYWNQEEPSHLWIGRRDQTNELLHADPALLSSSARAFNHYPGGHNEGWPDAEKNMMLQFYRFIREGKDPLTARSSFATFEDGHRSMQIIEAILKSHEEGQWVALP